MKSAVSNPGVVSTKALDYSDQFQTQFNQYLAKQHPIVRGLHYVLMGVAILTAVLACIFFFAALYQTILWAATGSITSLGKATDLPIAWVNFGLSMSFLVFPWGLDSMLMRVFPAVIFPAAWYRLTKSVQYTTGWKTIFAGFGIMCAGAPGASYMINLAVQALQKLF